MEFFSWFLFRIFAVNVSLQKQHWCLHVYFVSTNFIEFIYYFLQFLGEVFSVFFIRCHLQTKTILLLSFLIYMPFVYFFLVYRISLLWLGFPVLRWIEVAGVGILYLFLKNSNLIFSTKNVSSNEFSRDLL